MRVGVTSQNFRTITGHAGKARRFLIFEYRDGQVREAGRLDLPMGMAMHDFRGAEHPLYALDALITGGSGQGFVDRMESYGVQVLATAETDPLRAVTEFAAGRPLPPPPPHED